MTSEPPTSSDGTHLPPRHRPAVANFTQDATELDLWGLEDDLESLGDKLDSELPNTLSAGNRNIPAPREPRSIQPRGTEFRPPSKSAEMEQPILMNASEARSKNFPPVMEPVLMGSAGEFDGLESWEDTKVEQEIEPLPVKASVPEVKSNHVAASVVGGVASKLNENDKPTVLASRIKLTKVELIGIVVLVLLLFGGGTAVFLSSIHQLPVESTKANSNDFPMKGDHVTITSASSYWRAPITDGPNADAFRRGTELLPVLKISVSGGPAVIRVFFRNGDGEIMGDTMTRTIENGVFEIPATSGFDDLGMHAAYRTGESKPWTIEVLEMASGDVSGGASKKLFEMNVSTDRQ